MPKAEMSSSRQKRCPQGGGVVLGASLQGWQHPLEVGIVVLETAPLSLGRPGHLQATEAALLSLEQPSRLENRSCLEVDAIFPSQGHCR
jgi:hypothetical protein